MLEDAEEPWWIIGSVAVALQGGSPGEIRDVDVLLGRSDARRYFQTLKLSNEASTGDSLFRSDWFARWREPPVEIELMAGLNVNGLSGWQPIVIRSREMVAEGLYTPSRDELRELLIMFGRPKDVQRAATLP